MHADDPNHHTESHSQSAWQSYPGSAGEGRREEGIEPQDEPLIELHGAMWRDESGWRLVRHWFHAETGRLATISKNDRLALLKAELCFRFEQGIEQAQETPRWHGCEEALFGPDDLDAATQYLEAAIRNRQPVD
jgi:hypothetical protein